MAKGKFEDALSKLEDIVKKMESGDLSLENSLKAFEEGIRLVRVCSGKLDEAQRRVDLLLQEEGEPVVKPYREENGEQ